LIIKDRNGEEEDVPSSEELYYNDDDDEMLMLINAYHNVSTGSNAKVNNHFYISNSSEINNP